MASLPAQHPSLALHLTDRALNPILTSARSQTQVESLTSLTTTSLTAHAAASRLNLGAPTRMIVEHGPGAPVVLASFLSTDAAPLNTNGTSTRLLDGEPAGGGNSSNGRAGTRVDGETDDAAPMLVGIVVAGTSDEAMDARRAAARLERVGRQFQQEWVAEERGADDDNDGD